MTQLSDALSIIMHIQNMRINTAGAAIQNLSYTKETIEYTVKKVNDFPVPSRDVTNQTLSGRE
jgi:hypothetical protein